MIQAKWWEKLRFRKFATQMAERFSADRNLMVQLRKDFADDQDKNSYYDFFQFVEHRLKIKLENWEED